MAPPPVHPPARKLTSAASMLSWLPKAAVLLLAALASGASGLPVLATPTRYGVEEGMDADISWQLPPAANLASAHVICIMQSEPVKVLYHVDPGTPGPAPLPHQAANTLTPEMIFFFAIFILVVPGVLAVLERWYFRKRDQKKTVPIPCPLPSGTTCPCRGPHSDRLIAERV